MTRLLMVEDNAWVRQSAQELLAAGGFTVVAAFDAVAPAVRAIADGLQVDAALVDLGLPDGSGIAVMAALRRSLPAAVIVAFTVVDDAPSIFEALRAGARGYLLKSTAPARLAALMQEALDGGAPMSAPVARLVVESFRHEPVPNAGPNPDQLAVDRLTPRELEVLVLLAKGLSYPEVARLLGVGLGTVQSYVKTVYGKLEVSSKAEAATIATRLGLV